MVRFPDRELMKQGPQNLEKKIQPPLLHAWLNLFLELAIDMMARYMAYQNKITQK